ncbi:MAG: hypothetical protein GEV28_28055 [Actinophytocola sp.]|uniref:hypothetical protein n=1 Tax=Actinophytocola sp. TaxID=1872138 RepID=UPI00132067A1|nr:hypothetical protein [Actinophytocola sp.]MPZ84039.1 hypothetical protein [Actinophytocola sp.]
MNNPPRVEAWLEIPDDCRMAVALTFADELRFTLGNSPQDAVTIVFERLALERFVQLANDALKLTLPKNLKADLPELANTYRGGL